MSDRNSSKRNISFKMKPIKVKSETKSSQRISNTITITVKSELMQDLY